MHDDAFKQAVIDGDLDAVKRLLELGADPNVTVGRKRTRREPSRDIDPVGFTALHVAAYEDDAPLCELLLARGADPVQPSALGWLPIEIAANWSSRRVLTALLAAGVHPDAPSRFAGPLALAAARGELAMVEQLLAAGARNALAGALANSCSSGGDPGVLRALLDAGARPAVRDDLEWSVRVDALYYRQLGCLEILRERTRPETLIDAAIDGDEAAVSAFLDAGADPNRRLRYGIGPLLCAASMGWDHIVARLLSAGAEIDASSSVRGTPLVAALARGQLATAIALRAAGASLSDAATSLVGGRCGAEAWAWLLDQEVPAHRERILCHAAQVSDAVAVTALLAHGADPNGRDAWGRAALTLATASDAPEIVRSLLDAGADALATDRHGRPFLHYVWTYDDVTDDWDQPDFDPESYDRASFWLDTASVKLVRAAGARFPWET